MIAMILAAGRGERLRPLTDEKPKPLIPIDEHTLIEHQILRLKNAGINEIVINTAYLGHLIESHLGSGKNLGVHIRYSKENQALETGGGIYQALPFLGDEAFIVVNSDIWTDYPYEHLDIETDKDAHLVLVNNPAHHPEGDFHLNNKLLSMQNGGQKLTFSGIGLYHPRLFAHCKPAAFPLAGVLRAAMAQGRVSGEHYTGEWVDVGTHERLDYVRRLVKN